MCAVQSLAESSLDRVKSVVRELLEQGRDEDAQAVRDLLWLAEQKTDMPKYLTTTQAGRRLGVSRQTILNWVEKGMLPGVRIGRRTMIPASAFRGFERLEQVFDRMDAEVDPLEQSQLVEIVSEGRATWKAE
jgi:excisionase family DNA binding protein